MSFGQELKDFVSGFKAGSSAISEGRRAKAYRDDVASRIGKGKEDGSSEFQKAHDGWKGPNTPTPEQAEAPRTPNGSGPVPGPDAIPRRPDEDDDAGGSPSIAERRADLPSRQAIPVGNEGDIGQSLGGDVASAYQKSLNRTLQFEGGYNPNDAGKGPTAKGINSQANPDVDLKRVMSDPGYTAKIYKERYWNPIGGDQLAKTNPKLAHVAFDTSVNAGPGKARELLEASGGDPNKFLDLRKGFYDSLIENDPGKFGKYSKSWYGRIDKLRNDIGGGWTGMSSGVSPLPGSTEDGNGEVSRGALPVERERPLAREPGQQQGDQTPDGLKERSYADRYANPYLAITGMMAEGGMVPSYEDGGMVDREEDYRSMGAIPSEAAPAPAQQAVPADVEASAQTPAQAPAEGGALHGGLSFLQEHFGFNKNGGGALPDEGRTSSIQRFANGEGAADPKDYQAAMKLVDPKGEMTESLRNVAGLNAVYDYFLKKGDATKARSAAASLMMYTQKVAAQYGDSALRKAKAGDIEGAAADVSKAYSYVPDGKTVEAKNGQYVQRDANGKVVAQGRYAPEDVIRMALGVRTGSAYWEHVIQAAAGEKPMTTAQKQRQALAEQKQAQAEAKQAQKERDAQLSGQFAVELDDPSQDAPPAATPGAPNAPVPAPQPRPTEAIPTTPVTAGAGAPAPASAEGGGDDPAEGGGGPGVTGDAANQTGGPLEGNSGAPSGSTAPAPGAPPITPGVTPRTPPAAERTVPNVSREAVQERAINPEPAAPMRPFDVPAPVLTPRLKEMMLQGGPDAQKEMRQRWNAKVANWRVLKAQHEANERKRIDDDGRNNRQIAASQNSDRSRREGIQAQIDAQKSSQQQQIEANEKLQRDKIEAEKRAEERKQQHDIRTQRMAAMKPLDIDVTDDSLTGKFDKGLQEAWSAASSPVGEDGNPGDPKFKPEQIQGVLGRQNFRVMRDVAIELHRYNRLPPETAADATTALLQPGVKIKIEPIPDVEDGRVKVVIDDPNVAMRSFILPQHAVDALDVTRGKIQTAMEKQAKADEKKAAEAAERGKRTQAIDDTAASAIRSVNEGIESTVKAGVGKAADFIRGKSSGPSAMDTALKMRNNPRAPALNLDGIEKPEMNNPFRNPN